MDAATAVDGYAQSVHHPAQKAVPHGHSGGFQGPAHDAPGADLLAAAEEDAAQLSPAQVHDHALHPGGEEQDFTVLGVFQSADGGDLAVHRQHLADLLGDHRQGPVLRGLAHQGKQVVLTGLELAEIVGKLTDAPVQGPIIDVGPYLEAEAGAQGLILLPVERDFALIGPLEKVPEPLELGLGGFPGAAQLRRQAASSAPHGWPPPPQGLKTGQKGPYGEPGAWWPRQPGGAAHAGRSAGFPPGHAPPPPGRE